MFYNAKKSIIKNFTSNAIESITTIKITWWVEKNRQNCQSIFLTTNQQYGDLCPILSATRIALCAWSMNQLDDMPLAMSKIRKGKKLYLTGSKIAELLWGAIKWIHPDISAVYIKWCSGHSLHVWACILLDEVGASPTYLHWLVGSLCMYLNDTAIIQHQHVDALHLASQSVMDLMSAIEEDILALSSTMTEVTDDPRMQEYVNEED